MSQLHQTLHSPHYCGTVLYIHVPMYNVHVCVCVCVCSGEFLVYQREGASQAVDSRSGRRLNNAEICRMQAEHESHDQAVFQV